MSDEPTRAPRDAETVPVPDKGGWIDGETGPVFPVPPPDEINPTAAPQKAPPPKEPKKAS
jgi:hypothetical protein